MSQTEQTNMSGSNGNGRSPAAPLRETAWLASATIAQLQERLIQEERALRIHRAAAKAYEERLDQARAGIRKLALKWWLKKLGHPPDISHFATASETYMRVWNERQAVYTLINDTQARIYGLRAVLAAARREA